MHTVSSSFVASLVVAVAACGLPAAAKTPAEEVKPPRQVQASPDEPVEEVIVTATRPSHNRVPPLEYLLEVYDARRQGAYLYKRGRYDEAFPYLLTAAKRGFKFAQARVGFLYQQGLGTAQDPHEAVAWLGVAARGATMPEIRNHFNSVWAKIPDLYRPELADLIDSYERKYGAQANRVSCDTGYKAGTFVKHLTCRFMDEHLYGQTGETMNDLTATDVAVVGDG